MDKDIKIWMPSNEEFKIKKEDLEKCIFKNMKSQIEATASATFTIDPAFVSLARRFFNRERHTTEGVPSLPNLVETSSDDSSS